MPFTLQDFVSYQTSEVSLENLQGGRTLEKTSEVSCKALFAVYGWEADLGEEILEKLLSLNLERGKG